MKYFFVLFKLLQWIYLKKLTKTKIVFIVVCKGNTSCSEEEETIFHGQMCRIAGPFGNSPRKDEKLDAPLPSVFT